jgi:hypothetical protein
MRPQPQGCGGYVQITSKRKRTVHAAARARHVAEMDGPDGVNQVAWTVSWFIVDRRLTAVRTINLEIYYEAYQSPLLTYTYVQRIGRDLLLNYKCE